MTEKFKNAVKDTIYDGEINEKEKELLLKLAMQENISEIDAEIYIIKELKIRKIELNKENFKTNNKQTENSSTKENQTGKIIDVVGSVAIAAIPIILKFIGRKGK